MTDEVTAPAEPSPIAETPAFETADTPTPPEPQADPEPRSRMDSIEKAFADVGEGEAAEPAPESGQPRGPDGKFVAKEQEQPAAEEKPEETPEVDKGPLSEAPSRFSADAKEAWKDAPDSVKGEIKRAITELESGLAQKDEQLTPLKPFFDMAQEHGVQVHDVLGNYVRMEQLLAQDMRAGLTAVAQNFGMSLEQMVAQVTGQQQEGQPDPRDAQITALQTELHDLKGKVNGVSNNVQQSQEADLMRQIEAFASDPAHSRFAELEGEIARLIQTGYANDLPQAYDIADRLNPAPQPAPAEPTPTATPAQTRLQRSVTGAPNAGSDPAQRRPSSNRTEAIARSFERVGLS